MNIYVGNLSYDATEDQLREMFAAFGEVERASIVTDRATGRSRGFGFVEMPEKEEVQKFLFRDKFNEQLKKAGIKSEPLQILRAAKSPVAGYKLLRLKCSAKCKFGQALDLLANLKENPYLVGIEEFKIECDQKKRQDVKLDITVSTFVL